MCPAGRPSPSSRPLASRLTAYYDPRVRTDHVVAGITRLLGALARLLRYPGYPVDSRGVSDHVARIFLSSCDWRARHVRPSSTSPSHDVTVNRQGWSTGRPRETAPRYGSTIRCIAGASDTSSLAAAIRPARGGSGAISAAKSLPRQPQQLAERPEVHGAHPRTNPWPPDGEASRPIPRRSKRSAP